MILKVAYTGNDLNFLEDIKKVVEQYPLIKLETFCKDQRLYKIKDKKLEDITYKFWK